MQAYDDMKKIHPSATTRNIAKELFLSYNVKNMGNFQMNSPCILIHVTPLLN